MDEGADIERLAYLWIMTVQGHGVGLWEEYEGYPEVQHDCGEIGD